MKLTTLYLIAALTTPPLLALAPPHPNHDRGFDVGASFAMGEIDSVSPFHGNLLLSIPIGREYPVGPGLGYQLLLVWNSHHWNLDVFQDDDPTTQEIEYITQAFPHEGFTAGLGWSLSLGRLLPPLSHLNDSSRWVYVSRDGAHHTLYPKLHVGDGADSAFYSRDGSYLRMKIAGPKRIVEFPTGIRHTFEADPSGDFNRPIRFEDPFDNYVAISYDAGGWTISDQHGRRQRVELVEFDPHDDWTPKVVSEVRLEAFDGSEAVYRFSYTARALLRSCPHNDTDLKNPLSIPVLSEVRLPDGSKYAMPDYVVPSTSLLCAVQPGRIRALELPTGGRIEWTYRTYSFPRREGPASPPPPATQAFETSVGVATRRLVAADGTVIGTWKYDPVLTPNDEGGGGGGFPQSNEMVNTVTDPFGNKTEHYFSVDLEGHAYTGDWSIYDYGLPFTKDPETVLTGPSPGPEDDLYLSTRTFDSAGKLVRSTYVRYEKDVPPGILDLERTRDMNHRLAAERTVYNDDNGRWTQRTMSSFDGLGNYRTVVETGNFEGSPRRTRTTQFNPGRHYEVDASGNLSGSFQMIPASAPWILNTYELQTVNLAEGAYAGTSRVETTFNQATGFLECRRTLEGASRGADDVLVVFTDTDGDGFADREAYYGGDRQRLATSRGCGAAGDLDAEYRLDHAYQFGVRRSTDYVQECSGVAGGGHVLRTLDLTIDRRTGLARASRDISGLTTDYLYDDLGRLTTVKPLEDAWTVYDYRPAGANKAAVATIFRKNAGTTTRLRQLRLVFDGFGRACVRQEKLPTGGSWNRQDTLYHPTGWKKAESVVYGTTGLASRCASEITVPKTSFDAYDAHGRVGRIVPPDGAGHALAFLYRGVRQVDRTVRIATSLGGTEKPATTSQRFNPLGLLARVVDAQGLHTLYSYDQGGRLRRVAQGAQTRAFEYDGRGFLLREQHPELGDAGNGATLYCDYDSRGNAHRRAEGVASSKTCRSAGPAPNDLTFVFDRAQRLTQVLDTASSALMKELFYYRDNAPGQWRSGKLALAKRHNRGSLVLPLAAQAPQDAVVTETYTYGGRSGRISSRQTRLWGYTFDLGVTYDTLGQVTTLSYPRCSHAKCTDPARTVSFVYKEGRLTSVPGYASSITYHASGLINQVFHSNGITDTQGSDPFQIPRPGSIVFSRFPGLVGSFQYDGAGNVKRIGSHRYSYDVENRIAQSDLGTLGTQTYSYDRFGNRIRIERNGVPYSYPAAGSTNRLSGPGTLYDAAGNLLRISHATLSEQRYSYDVFNMLTSVRSASYAANYLYTADDERFVEIDTSGSQIVARYTLRGLGGEVLRRYEHVWGTGWFWTKDYLHRDGLMLASVTPEGARHFHLDHLGTPRLITSAGGSEVSRHTYFPFGDEARLPSPDPERRKFTGHERDSNGVGSSDDLDYMHARYYSPILGRFISTDPSAESVDPTNPQTWNDYAYTINNPLLYLDPDGEELIVFSIGPGYSDVNSAFGHSALLATSGGSRASVSAGTTLQPEPSVSAFINEYLAQERTVTAFVFEDDAARDARIVEELPLISTQLYDFRRQNCTTFCGDALRASGALEADQRPERGLLFDSPENLEKALAQGALSSDVEATVIFDPRKVQEVTPEQILRFLGIEDTLIRPNQ